MADEKATKKAPAKAKKASSKATPAVTTGEKCKAEKCKQPVRAKGYCRKHYMAWRRGKLGKKQRYNACSKEGCRKPATIGGRCAEHKKGAEAAAAA